MLELINLINQNNLASSITYSALPAPKDLNLSIITFYRHKSLQNTLKEIIFPLLQSFPLPFLLRIQQQLLRIRLSILIYDFENEHYRRCHGL